MEHTSEIWKHTTPTVGPLGGKTFFCYILDKAGKIVAAVHGDTYSICETRAKLFTAAPNFLGVRLEILRNRLIKLNNHEI